MWRDERGLGLVTVLLCATLFLALGGALVTVVRTETTISATFREAAVALAAAEAAIVRVIPDLAAVSDLDAALAGAAPSTFGDGAAAAVRTRPDGTMRNLVEDTNLERCGEISCTDAQMDTVTAERPWGVNNARWQVYGSGWLRDIASAPAPAPHAYVVVWIGDDPQESDGDPLRDDANITAAGHQVVLLRAVAYGAYSVRRRIEVVARREDGRVRVTSWREVR